MIQVLSIVAPVFAVILLGWLAARHRYLPDGAGQALAAFGFKVAMPAFLFKAVHGIGVLPGSPMALLAAYFSATVAIWLLAVAANRVLFGRPHEDGAAIAMGACFGNTVMLGIPLLVSAFGAEAAAPMALIVAVETPMMWVIATVWMEATKQRSVSLASLAGIAKDLARNAIVMSMLAGFLWRTTGLGIAPVVDSLLSLLAQAAVPASLFALGMTVGSFGIKGQWRTLIGLCALKMVVYPAVAWVSAVHLFGLPPLWAAIAVLFAAMPVGANAYLFAVRYDRAVAPVSGAIAVSTAASVLTLSALLFLIGKPT